MSEGYALFASRGAAWVLWEREACWIEAYEDGGFTHTLCEGSREELLARLNQIAEKEMELGYQIRLIQLSSSSLPAALARVANAVGTMADDVLQMAERGIATGISVNDGEVLRLASLLKERADTAHRCAKALQGDRVADWIDAIDVAETLHQPIVRNATQLRQAIARLN